jgi:hypothetical protein
LKVLHHQCQQGSTTADRVLIGPKMRIDFQLREGPLFALLLLCAAARPGFASKLDEALHCDALIAENTFLANAADRLGSGPYRDISVSGLSRIEGARLWDLLGGQEHDLEAGLRSVGIDGDSAAVLLARALESQLFASGTLTAAPGSNSSLELRLEENPYLSRAALDPARPLQKVAPAQLLAAVLGLPATFDAQSEAELEPISSLSFRVWRKRMDAPLAQPGCQRVPVDPRLFARVDGDGNFAPGILRGGLRLAELRGLRWLQDRGYPHAAIHASIKGGAMTITADEGALRSLEPRGADATLNEKVTLALGLHAGDIFSSLSLRRASEKLTDRYPFIVLDTGRLRGSGPADTRPILEQLKSVREDLGELYFSWDYRLAGDARDDSKLRTDPDLTSAGDAVELLGPGAYAIYLKARRATVDVDWTQLIRHTPATGFAPGLAATLHLWDLQDRGALCLDGAFAVNTKRSARALAGDAGLLERMSAQEELDWLGGARLAVPGLHLAEVGAQLYALTDTNDTWRMSDVNSYVHSALTATPDRDYFRRAGATALLTFHLEDHLTLGAEYHRDRDDPLPTPRVWSLVNDGSAPAPARVTPGVIGALLFRAEYTSDAVPIARVGKLQRHPETALSDRSTEPGPMLISLFTLELAKPGLGSDAQFDYLKLISDSRLQLNLGHDVLARLRLRIGAGNGLPLQKDEALGGWNALRGYEFKEFRGDASVLGSAEARWHWAGAFFDLGSVHAPYGFTELLPSAGAQLFLYRIGTLEAAWRLDGHGNLVPSARALLGWDI